MLNIFLRTLSQAEVVNASKSVKILELSEIMILHLMRFSYGSQGSTKLHKPVRFPLELVFGREIMVSPSSEVMSEYCHYSAMFICHSRLFVCSFLISKLFCYCEFSFWGTICVPVIQLFINSYCADLYTIIQIFLPTKC